MDDKLYISFENEILKIIDIEENSHLVVYDKRNKIISQWSMAWDINSLTNYMKTVSARGSTQMVKESKIYYEFN